MAAPSLRSGHALVAGGAADRSRVPRLRPSGLRSLPRACAAHTERHQQPSCPL
jgi:hypothetical protein